MTPVNVLQADDKTPQVVTIFVGGGVYGLPSKEYYNRSQIVANYTRTIADMFAIVNEDSNATAYEDLASKIVDLEGELARAQPDPDQANDVTVSTFQPSTTSTLCSLNPSTTTTPSLSPRWTSWFRRFPSRSCSTLSFQTGLSRTR